MTKLLRRDKVELMVAAVVVLVYFGLWASGYIPEDTPPLVHVLVGSSAIAILGDNVMKYLEKGVSAAGDE